ncbi:hypothetical protein NDA15_003247 [Ustilago hordei]|nr:hypothetical protein NDA15_003247 [Ustilago hordei]
MMDQGLNDKLDRLLALLEAQLELTRQGQREERLRRAHLSREETVEFLQSEDQADEQDDVNYEKYASPTRPRYYKPREDPYSRTRTEPYVPYSEEDTSVLADLSRSKPIATPFPKFNLRDVEIFILEAEAWFKFNQVYEQTRMINHMGSQLEGNAQEWWTSKLQIDRAQEGRLFNDWHYFTEQLSEQFNPRNARMEAYNKLLALKLTSDAPGATTCHVEHFRDLEGQCHGPGCSRSRRVMGSYGRSTGIEDLVEISREHGRSAVSMETMDSYGLTYKGGPSTATRRTKLKEQAQPRRGPSSGSMQMVTTQGLERQEPKELSLIKGGGAVSKESTPGHEEEEQCQRT